MPQTFRFKDKHLLITGGARGIGLAITLQFIAEGAFVTILDFNSENLATAIRTINKTEEKALGLVVDITDPVSVAQAVEQAEQKAPIDILINNAGIASETSFLDISLTEWQRIIEINLTGMFIVSQAVCRKMAARKKGVVINMSSKNGLDGEAGYAHYNSSKGGVIMLTKTMALELAKDGIRVNAVCPGYIQTPMSLEIDSEEFTQQFIDRYIPLNRSGRVEEVAPLFLFLASDESSFMTGQTYIIDGGQLAGQKPF